MHTLHSTYHSQCNVELFTMRCMALMPACSTAASEAALGAAAACASSLPCPAAKPPIIAP